MIKIPITIIRNENKEAVIEAARAYIYNEVFLGNGELPEILKDEPEVLKLLGVEHE